MQYMWSRVERQVDEPSSAIKNCVGALEQAAADKAPILFSERVGVLPVDYRIAEPQR